MQQLLTVLIVALLVAWALRHTFGALRRHDVPPPPAPDVTDPAQQLTFVSRVAFERQPLLNKSEFQVLLLLEAVVREMRGGHRVMAQTSLGEILRPKERSFGLDDAALAYRSINSKRADFVIVDRDGLAVLAVEYQGTGHYRGTARMRDGSKGRRSAAPGSRSSKCPRDLTRTPLPAPCALPLLPIAAHCRRIELPGGGYPPFSPKTARAAPGPAAVRSCGNSTTPKSPAWFDRIQTESRSRRVNLIKTVIAIGALSLVNTAVTPPAYACGSNPKAIETMKNKIERLNREAGFEEYKFTAFRGCAGGVIALNPAFVHPTPGGATAGRAQQPPGEASR